MDVVVSGIGLQSCFGSLNQSWQSILQGKSGLELQQPFPEITAYPLGMIATEPSNLSLLTKQTVAEALFDVGLEPPLTTCGIVIGSSRGYQQIWEQEIANNNDFATTSWLGSLPQQTAIVAAQQIQTRGIVLSPMAACATGIHALARAYELIATGACDRVIAGAVESPITPLSLAGFERMGALAQTGCYPFDRDRQGLVLGEGGAIFVLETAELALSRNARVYGKISGWGLSCDASSLTGFAQNSLPAAIAVKNCLEYSQLAPEQIDYIHAHGTSTVLNDRHEATLIQHLFDQSVAVSSTKGATGHTLGASGALGVAWCLLAIQSGKLPPCVGLNQSEFPLSFVRVGQSQTVNHALCFSFGFGGQNAILALSKL